MPTTDTIKAARHIIAAAGPDADLVAIAAMQTAYEAEQAAREAQGWPPLNDGWQKIGSN